MLVGPPPVDLYLNFEKSSWKNEVQRTGFLKLICAGYTGSKKQVRNRLKIQFVELDFSKLIFQKSSTDQQGVIFLGTSFSPDKYQKKSLLNCLFHAYSDLNLHPGLYSI